MTIKPFHFPKQGEQEAFVLSQELLGQIDTRFNYYFQNLIFQVEFSKLAQPEHNFLNSLNGNLLLKAIISVIDKQQPQNKKNKFDFLVNPFGATLVRNAEKKLLYNILEMLLDNNFKIGLICLEQQMLKITKKNFINHKNSQNLSFINPHQKLENYPREIIQNLSLIIAKLDYQYIVHLLREQNIRVKFSSRTLQTKIETMLAWFWVANQIEFETAILRVEWEPYSFLIKETARKRGKKTIAFQHGVISHTLDIPVTVNRFLTFGKQSAQFLQELNQEFAKTTGQTNLCTDFQACGAMIDDIEIQVNNFNKKTVLIVDQSVQRSMSFYGTESQIKVLEILLEKLLMQEEINKVIIRPHPEANISDFWVSCKHSYPDKFELSHPKFKLDMDIKRSSVAIGLFSGALAIAAASGLPTYWLKTPNGYYTRDLSCFDPFALSEEVILEDIITILSSQTLYLERRKAILELSQLYYKDNKKINFDENLLKLLIEV
ncbi:hypothetical protein PCC8801_0041 [Rippkaea orientalis PCC 8801]|uniref:Capsule polysaccharide biosynthesis protein n=1 Tax=Rippkaea orientalis (strain PCC 8801 / RF-1) TaxID=41431 RepID=B7JZI8_RIPO1|nr:hypothetical protein [Rippkaea orientalis]ACK64148.1 hypothetical protein PCC8801_0041 [Rippkaea orientalis PCC 8801]